MAYTSYVYLTLFLGLTFVLYTLFPKKYKWAVLLGASYSYYVLASRLWLIVFLLLSTVTVYLSALWIGNLNELFNSVKKVLDRPQKKEFKEKLLVHKKIIVVLMLLVNIGTLAFLKYYNFFAEVLNFALLDHLHISAPMLKLFLPLGISFYTLQAVSYVIDVYRGKYKADHNFFRVALFLSFFPTIVEGPIARYDQVANELFEGHEFSYENLTFGAQLILWGMFKKIVIADRANMLVNHIFDDYLNYSGFYTMIGIVFYTIQLYTEFSGAMDIVKGSAQIFGVHLPDNFRQPFFARSINEFWQRWHITLGAWLRDYVFYSVSLSKPFKKFSQFVRANTNEYFSKLMPATTALFFVWICNGLWHGASIKYVMYGMYYYFIMVMGMFMEPVFNTVLNKFHIRKESKLFQLFQTLRTILIVNIGMLIFRADTLGVAYEMFKSCFRNINFASQGGFGIDNLEIAVIIVGTIIVFIVGFLKEKGMHLRETIANWNIVFRWSFYLTALFVVIIFGAYGRGYDIASFIYAQF